MTTKLVRNVYGLSLEHSLVDNFNITFWEMLMEPKLVCMTKLVRNV